MNIISILRLLNQKKDSIILSVASVLFITGTAGTVHNMYNSESFIDAFGYKIEMALKTNK